VDHLGTLVFFRVLMIIGKYSEALEVLSELSDFKIQATVLALCLNESSLLKTRYETLDFIYQNKQEIK
jgi:hypothetical protein